MGYTFQRFRVLLRRQLDIDSVRNAPLEIAHCLNACLELHTGQELDWPSPMPLLHTFADNGQMLNLRQGEVLHEPRGQVDLGGFDVEDIGNKHRRPGCRCQGDDNIHFSNAGGSHVEQVADVASGR